MVRQGKRKERKLKKLCQTFGYLAKRRYLCTRNSEMRPQTLLRIAKEYAPLAQLVEQLTLNQWV